MIYKNEVLRFIVAGFISTTINYIFFIFFYKISSNLVFSASMGYILGFVNSYIFSKRWVFKNSKRSNKIILKFFFVHILSLSIMNLLIANLILLKIEYRLAWLLSIGVAVVLNFLGSKYFAFK